MKKGFTLIELLVVVLIIGILAAVALPQYTKAVEKSRTAEAMQVLGDLATAEQVYYMTKNEFVTALGNLGKLDISIPGSKDDCNGTEKAGIETGAYCVTLAKVKTADGTADENGKSVKATAERVAGGNYKGGTLTIQIDPDGKVTKGGSGDVYDLVSATWN